MFWFDTKHCTIFAIPWQTSHSRIEIINMIKQMSQSIESPGPKGEDCADLSTSMKFGIDVDQNILNSFFKGDEAGAPWGHHICQIQYGH